MPISPRSLSHALRLNFEAPRLRIARTDAGTRALMFEPPSARERLDGAPDAAFEPRPMRFIDDASEVGWRHGLVRAAREGFDHFAPDEARAQTLADAFGPLEPVRVPGEAGPVERMALRLTPEVRSRVLAGRTPSRHGKFSIAGEQARIADREALALAREMQAGGADRERIWRETGWAVGDDGMWRFELDTAAARLKGPLEAVTLSPIRPLEQVLDFPALFEAYPQLARAPVDIGKAPAARQGGEWDGKAITVRAPTRAAARSLLLHEVQHAIQDIEGFAAGGSPDAKWRVERKAPEEFARLVDQRVRQEDQRWRGSAWRTSIYGDDDARFLATERRRAEAATRWDLYERLAGEVEARDVQKRADWSPAERAALPPGSDADIAAPERIISFERPGDFGGRSADAGGRGARAADIEAEARGAWGETGGQLLDAGAVRVVQRRQELPDTLTRADGRVYHSPFAPVDQVADMPDADFARMLDDGTVYELPPGVGAVHVNGTTYFVADALQPARVRTLMLHEVGVHHGLEAMIGKRRFATLLRKVEERIVAGKVRERLEAVRRGEGEIGDDPWLKAYALADGLAAHRADVLEETVAYAVELAEREFLNFPDLADRTLLQRLVDAVKRWAALTLGVGKITWRDLHTLAAASLRRTGRLVAREAQQGERRPAPMVWMPQAELMRYAQERGFKPGDAPDAGSGLSLRNYEEQAAFANQVADEIVRTGGQFGDGLTLTVNSRRMGVDSNLPLFNIMRDGQRIGSVSINADETGLRLWPMLNKEHQRQGIGTQLYRYLERIGGRPLSRSDNLTEAGAGLWGRLDRERGAMRAPDGGAAHGAQRALDDFMRSEDSSRHVEMGGYRVYARKGPRSLPEGDWTRWRSTEKRPNVLTVAFIDRIAEGVGSPGELRRVMHGLEQAAQRHGYTDLYMENIQNGPLHDLLRRMDYFPDIAGNQFTPGAPSLFKPLRRNPPQLPDGASSSARPKFGQSLPRPSQRYASGGASRVDDALIWLYEVYLGAPDYRTRKRPGARRGLRDSGVAEMAIGNALGVGAGAGIVAAAKIEHGRGARQQEFERLEEERRKSDAQAGERDARRADNAALQTAIETRDLSALPEMEHRDSRKHRIDYVRELSQWVSQMSGVDASFIETLIARETAYTYDPDAQNPGSTALGFGQFTKGTWRSELAESGAAYNIDTAGLTSPQVLELRRDPRIAGAMVGAHARSNYEFMRTRLGRDLSGGELYAGHFFGRDKAVEFIAAAAANMSAEEMRRVFRSSIYNEAGKEINASVFREGRRWRSPREVMAAFEDEFGSEITPLRPEARPADGNPSAETDE